MVTTWRGMQQTDATCAWADLWSCIHLCYLVLCQWYIYLDRTLTYVHAGPDPHAQLVLVVCSVIS